ncbi:MAG: hypothetical protein HC811_10400 [Flammeovirgaceae bacterium]|nr:hypothetical protein [Flammeovirgaceae bacterium]
MEKNNEFYYPFFQTLDAKGRPFVEYSLVAQKIQTSYDSLELFISKIPPIYSSFTRSVNHYDKAVKIFSEISSEYTSIEDIYLLYDQKLDARLSALKNNYDSTIINFNDYQRQIKPYPIKNYYQHYTVIPIRTYRLDGLLTNINFLTNQINLWDYSSWVDQVRSVISKDVADLRSKIILSDQKLTESLNNLRQNPDSPPYQFDKKVAFNLNHFERQSLVLSILQYKMFMQSILAINRKQTDSVNYMRQAEVASSLIHLNRKADTLIQEAGSRYNDYRVSKHKEFIASNFNGPKGLESYINAEKKEIGSSYQTYSNELHQSLSKLDKQFEQFTNKEMSVRIGRLTIPLTVQSPEVEAMDNGTLFTLVNRKNSDGSAYLAGIYKPDKKIKNIVTYVARINPDGKPAWVKDFNVSVDTTVVSDANNYLGPLVLTQEGCAFLVHAVKTTGEDRLNSFIYLDEKGDQKLSVRLKDKTYPRKLLYSEKNNSFIMLLKGKEEIQNNAEPESISIGSANVLGDVLWRKDYSITGNVVDLIPVIDGYLIAGNYSVIKDLAGKEYRTKISSQECSPFVMKISEHGEWVEVNPISTPSSIYIDRVIKVNDNSINLIGFQETFSTARDKTFDMSGKFFYIMTMLNTQVISTNY